MSQLALAVGDQAEVTIGKVAHGGHFVARHEGQVLFVRHALPGELVRARITRVSKRFAFADAIEIRQAAPERVTPPCQYAAPGGCGGCDFQHVSLPTQRSLKQQVIEEQLQRLAGLELEVPVQAVPGDEQGLRWRTRMKYVDLPNGRRGLRAHHSHDVVEIEDCLIARPDAHTSGGEVVTETVTAAGMTHQFRVSSDGFWQVHPGAPATLVAEVLAGLDLREGETAWDLYAGVGLFAAFLAERVGESGLVECVEQDRRAVAHARENLRHLPQARIHQSATGRALAGLAAPQHVVLDPPRAGAGRQIVEQIAAAGPRSIAYVACDPAALARDLGYFSAVGYQVASVRGFDLFPMTHHVECIALLRRTVVRPQ